MFSFSLARMKAPLARFVRHEGGNYALVFALAMVPVSGTVAAAIDYSIMTRIKTELQAAVDGSVLAAARSFSDDYTTNKLSELGRDYFDGNYVPPRFAGAPTYSLTFGPSSDVNSSGEITGLALTARASVQYSLQFGAFVGLKQTPISATSRVNISSSTIEAAFVIDASGSMTDNEDFQKSTKAAHDMLQDLKSYALAMRNASGIDSDYVRYALVPFAWGVNVGKENKNAAWLDQSGWADHHHDQFDWNQGFTASPESGGWKVANKWVNRWTLFDSINEEWAGCVEARTYPYFLNDATPDAMNPATLYVPHFYPDEPDNTGGAEVNYTNSYATDNVSGNRSTIRLNGSNSGSASKQFDRQYWTSKYNRFSLVPRYSQDGLGPNRNCFEFAVLPLNNAFGQTNSNISNLNVTYSKTHSPGIGDDDGSTNIQQGLVWGWHALSSTPPFTEGRPESDRNNKKIAILITDGINSAGSKPTLNQSEYGAFGFVAEGRLDEGLPAPGGMSSRAKLDAQMLATCANMRAARIELYVVGYGVASGSYEEGLLQQCAGGSEPLRYYFPVTQDSIDAAMDAIRSQIVDMRLAG